MTRDFVRPFDQLTVQDVPIVGGKNASLGEMIRALHGDGIRIPGGFATTAEAYRHLIDRAELRGILEREIAALHAGEAELHAVGQRIRHAFLHAELPGDLEDAIRAAYRALGEEAGTTDLSVAVRSSATAEDLPSASFAGQQETFLNVKGERHLLDACRRCYASLFTDRAISYREAQGFDHLEVALSIGVQRMVRSDLASSGVMFTIDTETGFPDAVLIDAAWGLGETVVQGIVDPDAYEVFKPLLDREDRTPILAKRLGAKESKMVYARGGTASQKVQECMHHERERSSFGHTEVV